MYWSISALLAIASFGVLAQVPIEQKKSANYRYYFEKGEELLDRQEYDDALIHYNEAINLNPLFADAYFSRALIYEKQNNQESALLNYTIFVELNPNHYEGLFNRALILFSQKKWAVAKTDFQKLIIMPTGETNAIYFRLDPFSNRGNQVSTLHDNDKAHIFNYLGLTELELNELNSASAHFDSAIAGNPYNPDYFVNAGLCYEVGENPEKAKLAYQTALKLNPDHALALHNLGNLTRKGGSDDTADQMLDEVIGSNSELPFPYAERGYYALQKGDFAKAITDYNEAIRLAPADADYWLSRGLAKEKMRNWVGAYDDYSQALKLEDKMEQAWLHRANLLYQRGKYKDAIKDYDVALILNETYGIAFYNRGLAKYRLGQSAEACKDLKSADRSGFEVPSKALNKICGVQ